MTASALFKPDVQISRIRLTREPLENGRRLAAWPNSATHVLAGRCVPKHTLVGKPQESRAVADANPFPAGALRSTGITRLPRYYGPLRLLPWPDGGYGFPPSVVLDLSGSGTARTGLPGSGQICRRPLSPTTPESPAVASARCFTAGVRLRPFGGVSHSRERVSRGRIGFTLLHYG